VGFLPDELVRIKAAAAAEHLPVATWLRRAAFAALDARKE
jgi:hypothetical protein